MKDAWHLVNRCIVCGSKLKFVPSPRSDAVRGEGMKICDNNHAAFRVIGVFNDERRLDLDFVLPR